MCRSFGRRAGAEGEGDGEAVKDVPGFCEGGEVLLDGVEVGEESDGEDELGGVLDVGL